MTQTSTMIQKRDQLPQGAPVESGWLDPRAAAAIIGVTTGYIYNACAMWGLRHSRLAGKRTIRIKREWLEAWLERSSSTSFPINSESVPRTAPNRTHAGQASSFDRPSFDN